MWGIQTFILRKDEIERTYINYTHIYIKDKVVYSQNLREILPSHIENRWSGWGRLLVVHMHTFTFDSIYCYIFSNDTLIEAFFFLFLFFFYKREFIIINNHTRLDRIIFPISFFFQLITEIWIVKEEGSKKLISVLLL